MAQHTLVLDLETQKTFDEVGRENLHKLKVSVAGVYDYHDDTYRTYEEAEMTVLEAHLKAAKLIVGFNIKRFDFAVLAPYFFTSVGTFPVLDLMEEIEKVRGHRVSLQSVAQGTLGTMKSGQGLNAVNLYQQGKMDELKRYCLDDVRITKEIYEYGCANQRVYFISNRDWQKYEVPVDWGEARAAKKEPVFPTSLF